MTEEFKKYLMMYLTRQKEERPISDLKFSDTETLTSNLDTQLTNKLTYYSINGQKAYQGTDGNGNKINIYYIFGSWGTTELGFIGVLDKNFNLLSLLTKYTSGVSIGYIHALNVDEDGYISIVESRAADSKRRFVMLNNIGVISPTQTYYAKIRKAYELASPLNGTTAYIKNIFKRENSSEYAFVGAVGTTYTVQTLKINVGSDNEWTNYTYTKQSSDLSSTYPSYNSCYWSGDNFHFYLVGDPTVTLGSNNAKVPIIYNSGETISTKNISIAGTFNPSYSWVASAEFVDNNWLFMGTVEQAIAKNQTITDLFAINASTGQILIVKSDTFTHGTVTSDYSSYKIIKLNGCIGYFLYHLAQGKTTCDIQIGICKITTIYDVISYEHELGVSLTNTPTYQSLVTCLLSEEFELYTFSLNWQDTAYKCYTIWKNQETYASEDEPAYSLGCLKAKRGVLYNSNNYPIFARELYNRTVNGAITTCTIEVPNNFLNDETIAKECLVGLTNADLISNQKNITKNIYETLYINFISTLSAKCENGYVYQNTINLMNNAITNYTYGQEEVQICYLVLEFDNEKLFYFDINTDEFIKITDTKYQINKLLYVGYSQYEEITSIYFADANKNDIAQVQNLHLPTEKLYKFNEIIEIN